MPFSPSLNPDRQKSNSIGPRNSADSFDLQFEDSFDAVLDNIELNTDTRNQNNTLPNNQNINKASFIRK